MTTISWEWIAGFFEGEGCLYWREGEKGTRQGTSGRCVIGQKCKEPLQAVYDFLIERGYHPPAFYLRPASVVVMRSIEIWIISVQWRDDVIDFLSNIEPFLFQKREKALYILERLTNLRDTRNTALSKAMELRKSGISWREVARQSGIGRTALANYARSASIALPVHKGFGDEMDWRDDRIARGLCEKCGKPRGENGTARKCRKCADVYNTWRNAYRKAHGR